MKKNIALEKLADEILSEDKELYEELIDGKLSYSIAMDFLKKLFISGYKAASAKKFPRKI